MAALSSAVSEASWMYSSGMCRLELLMRDALLELSMRDALWSLVILELSMRDALWSLGILVLGGLTKVEAGCVGMSKPSSCTAPLASFSRSIYDMRISVTVLSAPGDSCHTTL
jgi:hypothetical protein